MASDQWLPIGSDLPAADQTPPTESRGSPSQADWLPADPGPSTEEPAAMAHASESREAEAPEPPEVDAAETEPPSLAALIRDGDPDALLGFRDAHEPAVRAYMETLCSEDTVDEAVDSCFTDMFGRLTADEDESTDLEALLLVSARSVAAGRFEVTSDRPHGPDPTCRSVPELLAARDNGELESAEQLERHVEGCPTCQGSAERMREAEQRFAAATPTAAGAQDPEPDPAPKRAPAQEPEAAAPEPEPDAHAPEPAPAAVPPPQTVVRRSGGLVRRLRKSFEDISRRRSP